MPEQWHIRGEYLESCNCTLLCPCLLGPRNERGGALARPTEGHCDVPVVFQIQTGEYGTTKLDGLHAALAVSTPGAMGAGDWTMGLYLDAGGTPEQQTALGAIFGGDAGGVLARITPLVTRRLPTRIVPITFGQEGRRRWASIPGVLDVEVQGIEGRDRGSPVWLENVRHFVSHRLAAATSTRSTYRDHGFAWDLTGRNAHFASFDWTGP